MKKRFLGLLICFALGLSVGYGLAYLDRQTRVPRLQRTEVFEVVFPDGTDQHLSYAEVEREREELRRLRARVAQLEGLRAGKARPPGPGPGARPGPAPAPAEPGAAEPQAAPGAAPPPADAAGPQKKLGDLFAKLFSKPVMEEIVRSQAERQAGELSAVLDLSPEQAATLLAELEKRKREALDSRSRPEAGRAGPAREARELDELSRTLFTPEQLQRYEEYNEKKKSVRGAPPPERELLEVAWRLHLSPEQEARAGAVLRDQWEKIQQLSPVGGADEEASPLDQFNQYLDRREEIVTRSTEQMKAILDEDQMAGYAQYLGEKDTETRLLQKMIRSESPDGPPGGP